MRSRFYKRMAIEACLLALCMMAVWVGGGAGLIAHAQSAEQETVTLALHKQNPEENVPLQMSNMFPGDAKTMAYRLDVSYTGTITVYFHASLREGSEKLTEVLWFKVSMPDTDEVLYEGSMGEMMPVGYELSTDKVSLTKALIYEITVGLSTAVGNEYQGEQLLADFHWWAEGADPSRPTDPSQPTEPEEPTDPSQPTEPEEPTDSSYPETSEKGEKAGELADPNTGDDSRILLWLMLAMVALAAMVLLMAGAGRYRTIRDVRIRENGMTKSQRRLLFGILAVVCLVIALGITSLALVYQRVSVEENLFETGRVSLNLNDGEPVFRENVLFEPGMVIKKEFTLCNEGSCDVYYRLYFDSVEGALAEALMVEVYDSTVEIPDTADAIFAGTLQEMNGQKSEGADGFLKEGEECIMTIVFRVPSDCTDEMQGQTLFFHLNAEAVQAVNNPDGLFD